MNHLLRVRDWFLGRGFNCYPLFAPFRPELRTGERDLLRGACEHAPRSLGSQVVPLFPIVLLGPDLSTAPLEEDHPRSWGTATGAYENLSSQSRVRNLGLTSVEWIPTIPGAHGNASGGIEMPDDLHGRPLENGITSTAVRGDHLMRPFRQMVGCRSVRNRGSRARGLEPRPSAVGCPWPAGPAAASSATSSGGRRCG
jgi:hypothetical protein